MIVYNDEILHILKCHFLMNPITCWNMLEYLNHISPKASRYVLRKEVLAFAIDELCSCYLHMLYHVNEFCLMREAHWFGEFKRTEVVLQMIYTFFIRKLYIKLPKIRKYSFLKVSRSRYENAVRNFAIMPIADPNPNPKWRYFPFSNVVIGSKNFWTAKE